jgi:hypothetical protein
LALREPGAFLPVLAPATVFEVDGPDPDPAIPLDVEAENDMALENLEAFVAFESEVKSET